MNEEIKKIFDEWGKDTVIAIQALLTAQRNVATGNLRRSIKYVLGENFIQFTMAEYGKYVDEGTRPHWAPIAPFKKWASAKGLKPSVAYAVRASIAKKGTKAHRFFQVAIEKEIANLLPQLDEGFIRFLDNRITLLNNENNQ
jgi:hypothetical protein